MASKEGNQWEALLPKAKIVGIFGKHSKDHEKEKKELDDFLCDMKKLKKELKIELEEDAKDSSRQRFEVRKNSIPVPPRVSRYTDKDLTYPFNKDQDIICNICQKGMDPFEDVWYPCRVCNRVFHRKCLEDMPSLHKSVLDTLERASTNTGWSCHHCNDLSLLLREDELDGIIEKFDQLDENKDSKISLAEFISYNAKLTKGSLSEQEKEQLRIKFKLMDLDRNCYVDWWEFLNNEAQNRLAVRDTDELIEMLTEKEVIMAKAMFTKLDENKDGTITEMEATRAFKNWYQRFEEGKKRPGIDRDSTDLNLHTKQATRMVMDCDVLNTGTVTWEDFLAGQALYIIASRPNLEYGSM